MDRAFMGIFLPARQRQDCAAHARIYRSGGPASSPAPVDVGIQILEPRVGHQRDDPGHPAPAACPPRSRRGRWPPDEVPAKSPSSRARRLAISLASAVTIGRISSTTEGSQSGGRYPIPIPSILCGPGGPPPSTADSAGSTTAIRTPGLRRLSTVATPREEAAVPTLWTNAPTAPRSVPRSPRRARGIPRSCPRSRAG